MSDDFVDRVRAANDILDVVGEFVQLKSQGRNYVGLCPFHQEKTPSFSVAPDKQLFYCFGCKAGGDVFKFIELWEGVDFPEALDLLARRAGIEREESRGNQASPGASEERREMLALMEQAAAFFRRILWKDERGQKAREYCRERGLNRQVVEDFQLGSSLPGWQGLGDHLRKQGVSPEMLVKTGLAIAREGGGYYDRFRGRLMFPLWDQRGNVIAFGARSLAGEEPKYLNSPETPLFSKGKHLYALHLARRAMRQSGSCVIVEGYLDAIALHQFGWKNVVASLGTALTSEQARLLRQNTERVYMAFDPDAAGRQAALKGIRQLRREGLEVWVVPLPADADPDDLVRREGVAGWERVISQAQPLLDFYLDRLRGELDFDNPDHVTKAVDTLVPMVMESENPVEREAMVRKAAGELGVTPDALWSEFNRQKSRAQYRDHSRQGGTAAAGGCPIVPPPPKTQRAQEELLGLCLVGHAEIGDLFAQVRPEDFSPGALREVARGLWEEYQKGEPAETGQLTRRFTDPEVQQLVSRLVMEASRFEASRRPFQDCVRTLLREKIQQQIRDLRRRIVALGEEGNREQREKLEQELSALISRYRHLA